MLSQDNSSSIMDVIVHLNGIADNSVMKKRMEHAFGDNGLDFWKTFFLCKNNHPDEKIIYLFTESQLKTLNDWLIEQARNKGLTAEKNLEFSKQDFFNTSLEDPKLYKKKGKMHFGYVKYKEDDPHIETLRFAMSPPEEYMNDFFDKKKFIKTLSDAQTGESTPQEKVNKILKLKRQIAVKILQPRDEKWLRYFGPRILEGEHKSIEYCAEKDPKCPLILAISNDPATPAGPSAPIEPGAPAGPADNPGINKTA